MKEPFIHSTVIERGVEPASTSGEATFPWWSFTKTVLAAAALKLVERGRLALEETLPGRPYTLRQLLQHRAGVPNYGGLEAYHDAVARGDDPWPAEELLARVRADQLDFAPDRGWTYSNVGYFFVRGMIEETVDQEIGDALAELVFAPLGLSSSRVVKIPDDLDDTAFGNAAGYHPGWVYHGLLVGPASDAVRFLDGLMAGRLLRPDLLKRMTTVHPLGWTVPGRPWTETGYGLGLMSGRMAKGGRAVGHSGVGPSDVCAIYHFPETHPPRTAAAFTRGHDEGVTEHAVDRLIAERRSASV